MLSVSFLLIFFLPSYASLIESSMNDELSTEIYETEDGLVAYWPFDGDAMDESGGDNHGTIIGATLTLNRFGIPGKAYSFDGVDDYIRFAPVFF